MVEQRIEVISTPAEMEKLAEEWKALAHRVPGYQYIQTFEWCRLCWKHYADRTTDGVRIVTVWNGDRLTGVWPFVLRRILTTAHLRPLGCGHGDTAHPLVEPAANTQATARDLCRALSNLGDIAHIPLLPAGSMIAAALLDYGYVAAQFTGKVVFVGAENTETWDAFMGRYSANMRRSLRSDRKKLAALGELRFQSVSDPEAKVKAIKWTFDQKQAWLVRHGLRELWYEGVKSLSFLKDLATLAYPYSGLQIFTLELDGQIVASRLCLADKTSLAGLAMTFDPEFGRFSPGMLITEDVLEWSFNQSLTCNMGGAGNELKARWATRIAEYESLSVSFTGKGRMFRRISALKASVGSFVRGRPGTSKATRADPPPRR